MGMYDEKTGDLITWLKTKAAITAVVGTGTAAQIYPRREPQDVTGRALVFDRVTGQQFINLGQESGIRRDVLHFYSYGDKASEADGLDEIVHDVLSPGGVPLREVTMVAVVVNLVRQLDGPSNGEDMPVKSDARYRYWTMSAYEFYLRQ